MPENPELVESVSTLLQTEAGTRSFAKNFAPSLMVVSYRMRHGKADDVVLQLFHNPFPHDTDILHKDGHLATLVGDGLLKSADYFLGLVYSQVVYLGEHEDVRRQQRAYRTALQGDLTLVREQTVEPLRVVAVFSEADHFLPRSLRKRVTSIVVDAELTFGVWHSRVNLLAEDKQTALQAGNIVAAWREMALSMVDVLASNRSGNPLHDAVRTSSVQVADNRVVVSASVPSRMVVRVAQKVAGHLAEPRAPVFWLKNRDQWPVTEMQLGSVAYDRPKLLSLLKRSFKGDASIILAHQLIAAKLNVAAGVPSTAETGEVISEADALLGVFTGNLPYKTSVKTSAGQTMINAARVLEQFNNGLL